MITRTACFVAVAAAIVSGCAAPPTLPDPSRVTNSIGARFAGAPVTNMIEHYGAPVRQIQVAGETIYSWERSQMWGYGPQPQQRVRCQLDAYVPATGIVRTIGLSGQNAACPMFDQ